MGMQVAVQRVVLGMQVAGLVEAVLPLRAPAAVARLGVLAEALSMRHPELLPAAPH